MNVNEKLLAVQTSLSVPKNQRNNFGNYNYRSCEDILEALKPLLAENKATIYIADGVEMVGERIYIKSVVRFIDVEKGDFIEVSAFAREEENKKGMDSMQLTGATSSYARKYALNGLFGIDDNKDSDHTNEHGKGTKELPKKEYKCCDCGKPFEGFMHDGKSYNAGQAYHIAESKNPDKKARCRDCRLKKESEG